MIKNFFRSVLIAGLLGTIEYIIYDKLCYYVYSFFGILLDLWPAGILGIIILSIYFSLCIKLKWIHFSKNNIWYFALVIAVSILVYYIAFHCAFILGFGISMERMN